MSSYRLTSSARQDVLDIYDYIAADNPDAADRFVDELYHAFDHLVTFPRTGHPRGPRGNTSSAVLASRRLPDYLPRPP